jgi:RHS repeat-associated protein
VRITHPEKSLANSKHASGMRTCLYDFCRRPRNTTYQHDNDASTDLDYAMARYYASRMGRFMTPDPGHVGANVGDPQSWNAYVYALNDPISRIDRNGMWATGIHADILTYGLGNYLSDREIDRLIQVQWSMDLTNVFRGAGRNYEHAMCDPGQDQRKCKALMSDSVRSNVAMSRAGIVNGQFTGTGLEHFGRALHTLQDFTSPAHVKDGIMQEWRGGVTGFFHRFGEDSPADSWFGVGQAMRISMALYMSLDSEGASQKGLTPKTFESELRKNIETYVESFYLPGLSNFGGTIFVESAKACAMGNPAACIGL